jgi:hypothetical protein
MQSTDSKLTVKRQILFVKTFDMIRGSYLAIIINLFTLESTIHFGKCLQKVNKS